MAGSRRIIRNQFKGHHFKVNPLSQDKDTAQGKNWYVDREGHIVQRPGVQLVTTFTEPTNAAGSAVMTTVGETAQTAAISSFGMLGMFEFINSTSANIWVGNYSTTAPTGDTATNSSNTEATYDANTARAPSELYVVSPMSVHRITPVVVSIDYSTNHSYTMRWTSGTLYIRVKTDLDTESFAQALTPTFTLSSLHSLLPSPKRSATGAFSQSSQLAQTLFMVDGVRNTYSGVHIYAHIADEFPTAYPLGNAKVKSRNSMLYPLLTNVDDGPIYPVNHNGNVYWAGRSAPLMKFNGYRTSLAGVPDIEARGTFLSPLVANDGGATLSEGTYQYMLTYCVYDPSGAVWESTPLTASVTTDATTASVTIPMPVEQAAGSLLTRAAKYASNSSRWAHYMSGAFYRSSGTIYTAGAVASSDSTMFRVGEPLGYWDAASATRKTTRVVENGVGGGAITFSPTTPGDTPIYFDVGGTTRIYRTIAGGDTFYLVAEVPFIDVKSTYTDTMTDATLITHDAYLDTAFTRGAPPRVTGHMCVHQGRLIVVTRQIANEINDTGLQNTPQPYDTIAWSEANSEYFPEENSVVLPQQDADIVAVASFDDVLYVLTKTGVWTISGDLSDATAFTVSRTSGAAGCVSAGSVAVLPDGVMYLSNEGFCYLGQKGAAIDPRSVSVTPELPVTVDGFERGFRQPYNSTSTDIYPLLDTKLAKSAVLREKRWYCCFIPTTYRTSIFASGGWAYIDSRRDEENISGTVYGTEASKTYPGSFNFFTSEDTGAEQAGGYFCVYDFANDRWYLWTNIDASGGMVSHNGELYGCTTKPGTAVWKLSEAWPVDYATSGSTWTPISFQYITAWEDADDPAIFKQFPKVQLYSLKEGIDTATLAVYVDRDWSSSSTVTASVSMGLSNKFELIPTTNEKCHVMRLRIESTAGENTRPCLSGWTIEASGDFRDIVDD